MNRSLLHETILHIDDQQSIPRGVLARAGEREKPQQSQHCWNNEFLT
jgi:hypothetical protein